MPAAQADGPHPKCTLPPPSPSSAQCQPGHSSASAPPSMGQSPLAQLTPVPRVPWGASGASWHPSATWHHPSTRPPPPVPSTTSMDPSHPTSRHSLAQPTPRHTAPPQGVPRQKPHPLAPAHPHVALSTAQIRPVFSENTPMDKDTIVGGGQGLAEGGQGHGAPPSKFFPIGQNRPLLRAQGAGGMGAKGCGVGEGKGLGFRV